MANFFGTFFHEKIGSQCFSSTLSLKKKYSLRENKYHLISPVNHGSVNIRSKGQNHTLSLNFFIQNHPVNKKFKILENYKSGLLFADSIARALLRP